MSKRTFPMTGVIAAAMLWHLAHGSVMAQESPEARGEALAIRHCAMCHAVGRRGASPNPLARPFRTMGRSVSVETLEGSLRDGAPFGHPMMPGFALSARDANAVVRYLRSIQEP